MGLLNDAKSRKQMTNILVQHSQKIIVTCFVIGIIWYSLLASDAFNNKTYFSENALLPGLVVREFNPGLSLHRRYESLKEEASTHSNRMPTSWIQAQFRQIGLDVYHNNFTLLYPFGLKSIYQGNNLYAILRAPKVSSTEAIVISTPYRGYNSIHDNTLPTISLMIELAKTFRKHTYWSKDIIFLITEYEMVGFQAWLDAYHEVSTSKYIFSENLRGISGLIQGVINLEITNDRFSYIDIKIEGLNGQLPNLDLFNLAVELCNREMVMTSFHSRFNFYHSDSLTWDNWKHNIITLGNMMMIHATGLPTGGHGLFHRFGIQAITLASKTNGKEKRGSVSLIQMGRVLEGIIRSLNNLLEKFHQSFFFYLLPNTRNYISIGLYMPPFALIALPVLIKALYLYLNIQKSNSMQEYFSSSNKINYWIAHDIITIHLLFGIILYFSPSYVGFLKKYLPFSLQDTFYYVHLSIIFLWFLFIHYFNHNKTMNIRDYSYKMCLILLIAGGFFFTLSLINISFASLITLFYVPLCVTLEYRGRFSCLQYLYLILINPFVFTYLIIMIQSYYDDYAASWWVHFVQAFHGHKKLITYTIEDLYLYDNWNYKIISLIILPIWFNLWSLRNTIVN